METTQKKHRYIFDYIRLLSCMAVIGGHVIGASAGILGNGLSATFRPSLPMFFLLTGVLNLTSKRDESVGKFYLKRFESIVIPAFMYGMYYACFVNQGVLIFTRIDRGILALAKNVFWQSIIDNLRGPVVSHLWFVYEMIGLYIIMPFIKVMMQSLSEKMQKWLFVVIFVSQILTVHFSILSNDEISVNHFHGWISYVLLGFLISQEWFKKYYKPAAIIGFLTFVFTVLWWTYDWFPLAKNHFDLAPQMMVQGIGLYCFYILMEDKITHFEWLNKVVKWIASYTFEVYLIHMVVIVWWVAKIGYMASTVPGCLLEVLGVFVISLGVAIVVNTLITKNVQRLFRFVVNQIGKWSASLVESKAEVDN